MRFLGATPGFVDAIVTAYIGGADMDEVVPGTGRVEAEHFACGALAANLLARIPLEEIDDVGGTYAESDLPMLSWHDRMEDAARRAPARERGRFHERARRVLRKVAETPTATTAVWYGDIYAELAHQAARRGDADSVELARRALAYAVFLDGGRGVRAHLRDLGHVSLMLGRDEGATIFTSILRHDPADVWTYVVLRYAADDAGLSEVAERAARRGLDVLAAKTIDDADSVRAQLNRRLTIGPDAKVEHVAVGHAVLSDLRAALDGPGAGSTTSDLELAYALVPDLASVQRKRRPEESDLIPREQILAMFRRHGGEWPPAGAATVRGARVGRNDKCPCGSGKKYKRCCGSSQATQ